MRLKWCTVAPLLLLLQCLLPLQSASGACVANQYSLTGGASCGQCAATQFVSSSSTCTPPASGGPSDTVFYLACDATETLGGVVSSNPIGSTFVADRFGAASAALTLSAGQPLITAKVGVIPGGSQPRTISFWLKCSPVTTAAWILQTGFPATRWCFGFYICPLSPGMGGGDKLCSLNGYGYDVLVPTSAPVICDSTNYHHLAATNDGSTSLIYIDGMAVAIGPQPSWNTSFNQPLYLGQFAGANNFGGTYDDIRVYSRALSALDIARIFRSNATYACGTVGQPQYSTLYSPGCSPCGVGATFVAPNTFCQPGPGAGPVTTAVYLSFDAAEGLGALVTVAPAASAFVADRFGVAGGALQLHIGAGLSTPPLAALPAMATVRTLSLWAMCSPPPAVALLVHWGSAATGAGFGITIGAGQTTIVAISGWGGGCNDIAVPASSTPVCDSTSQFHHIAVTYDGTTAQLFIDGSIAIFGVPCAYATTAGSPLHFGRDAAGNQPIASTFDDVRIFARALSPAEVVQLYKGNSSWACSAPGQWRLAGSPGCSACAPGDLFISASTFCRPRPGSGATDTVAHIEFDQAEGLGALTTTLPQGASYTSDRFGNPVGALSLLGSAPLVSPPLSTLPSGNSPRSFSLWVKCAPTGATPATSVIFHWGGQGAGASFGFNIAASSSFPLSLFANGFVLPQLYPICDSTNWHHFAATFDGVALATVYVDGQYVANGTRTYATSVSSSIIFGGFAAFSSQPFTGAYDDLRIWARALSAAEVAAVFNPPSVSSSATRSVTPTVSASWSSSRSLSPSSSLSPSAFASVSTTPSYTPSRSASRSESGSISPTRSSTPGLSRSPTGSVSPSSSVTKSVSRSSSVTRSESREPSPSRSYTAYGTGSSTPASTVTATTSPGSFVGAGIGGALATAATPSNSFSTLYTIIGVLIALIALGGVACGSLFYINVRKMKRIKGLVRGSKGKRRPRVEGGGGGDGDDGDDALDDEEYEGGTSDGGALKSSDGAGLGGRGTTNPMLALRSAPTGGGGVADAGLALRSSGGSGGKKGGTDKVSFGVTTSRAMTATVRAPPTSAAAAALGVTVVAAELVDSSGSAAVDSPAASRRADISAGSGLTPRPPPREIAVPRPPAGTGAASAAASDALLAEVEEGKNPMYTRTLPVPLALPPHHDETARGAATGNQFSRGPATAEHGEEDDL